MGNGIGGSQKNGDKGQKEKIHHEEQVAPGAYRPCPKVMKKPTGSKKGCDQENGYLQVFKIREGEIGN